MAYKRRRSAFLAAASAMSRAVKRRRSSSSKSSGRVAVSNKLRSGRSYSRTGTKTRRKLNSIRQDGTGTSKSFAYWRSRSNRKMTKFIKWEDNPQIYEVFNEGVVETDVSGTETPGVQAVSALSPILNNTDLSTMQNQILNLRSSNSTTGTNTAFLPNFSTSQKAFKLFVESAEQFVLFTNLTNSNVVVDIYDFVARRDNAITYSPVDQWSQGQAIDEAGVLPNQSSATLRGVQVPFSMPSNSRPLQAFYTMKRHTRVELAQGRSHEHTHKHFLNRMIDMELINTTGLAILKGVTSYVMLVIRGQPCSIGLGAVGTPNFGATLSPAKIAVVYRTRYRWRLGSTTPTIYNNSGLPLPTAYGGGSIINVLSEGSGLAQTFSQT